MWPNERLEELRRRVEKDPASVAFAQLAEEYRRAGDYEEAIRVARNGLAQHPGYLSARVTLGRALVELGQYDDARTELEQVLRAAPDNLAAIRALADIHQRREDVLPERRPEGEGRREGPPPESDTTHSGLETDLQVGADIDLRFDGTDAPFAEALQRLDVEVALPWRQPGPAEVDPALPVLEAWLAAIRDDRARRAAVHHS